MTDTETHATLCARAAELTAAGRPIPESLRLEIEHLDRTVGRADFGDLHDYQTGEYLRPATERERDRSLAEGPEGAWARAGRTVYVANIPEAE